MGEKLGEGTFGKVKKAVHILTGEKVAVKILEKRKILQESDKKRVEREIRILKLVKHPYIVRLYSVIQTSTTIYLITELAEGIELFDYISKSRKLPEHEACGYFSKIISAVEYLSQNSISHRDLKPENVILCGNSNIKIVDFGLSNVYSDSQLLETACGSPCYAAPEMLVGKSYNGLGVDIWSSGIILYAMICGFLPFEDKNTDELYKKIKSGTFAIPSFVSDHCRDLIRKILTVDPKTRITISQIKSHPWLQTGNTSFVDGLVLSKYVIPIDEEIIEEMSSFGFPKEETRSNILSNKHNSFSTTYYLLVTSKAKKGRNSVSDLSSIQFVNYLKDKRNKAKYYDNDLEKILKHRNCSNPKLIQIDELKDVTEKTQENSAICRVSKKSSKSNKITAKVSSKGSTLLKQVDEDSKERNNTIASMHANEEIPSNIELESQQRIYTEEANRAKVPQSKVSDAKNQISKQNKKLSDTRAKYKNTDTLDKNNKVKVDTNKVKIKGNHEKASSKTIDKEEKKELEKETKNITANTLSFDQANNEDELNSDENKALGEAKPKPQNNTIKGSKDKKKSIDNNSIAVSIDNDKDIKNTINANSKENKKNVNNIKSKKLENSKVQAQPRSKSIIANYKSSKDKQNEKVNRKLNFKNEKLNEAINNQPQNQKEIFRENSEVKFSPIRLEKVDIANRNKTGNLANRNKDHSNVNEDANHIEVYATGNLARKKHLNKKLSEDQERVKTSSRNVKPSEKDRIKQFNKIKNHYSSKISQTQKSSPMKLRKKQFLTEEKKNMLKTQGNANDNTSNSVRISRDLSGNNLKDNKQTIKSKFNKLMMISTTINNPIYDNKNFTKKMFDYGNFKGELKYNKKDKSNDKTSVKTLNTTNQNLLEGKLIPCDLSLVFLSDYNAFVENVKEILTNVGLKSLGISKSKTVYNFSHIENN